MSSLYNGSRACVRLGRLKEYYEVKRGLRQEAASAVYRESRGLRKGEKIRAYGWSWDNPGRNSVVRERENRRVVKSRRCQKFPRVVCESPKCRSGIYIYFIY